MKKNNNIKPEDIKYEPVEQERLPLWMHSIEHATGRDNNANRGLVAAMVILAVIALILGVASNI